ncbi:MAG: hypothetical protein WC119_01010 [Synergistaceae bacterium]
MPIVKFFPEDEDRTYEIQKYRKELNKKYKRGASSEFIPNPNPPNVKFPTPLDIVGSTDGKLNGYIGSIPPQDKSLIRAKILTCNPIVCND